MVYGFKTYTHPFDLTVSGRLLVAPTINRTTYTPTCHSERSEESKRHINEIGLIKTDYAYKPFRFFTSFRMTSGGISRTAFVGAIHESPVYRSVKPVGMVLKL